MQKTYVEHNTLDDMFYHDIFQRSFILHRYLKQGSLLFNAYDDLMQDTFFLLYKMMVLLKPSDDLHINFEILRHLKETPRVGKLRARTKGSNPASYIAMKYILDGLLDYARGKLDMGIIQDKIDRLNKDYASLKKQLEKSLSDESFSLANLFTDEEMDLLRGHYKEDQLEDFIQALSKSIFGLSSQAITKNQPASNKNTDFKKPLEEDLRECFKQPQTTGKDPIKDLIEKVIKLGQEKSPDETDTPTSDLKEEIQIEDASSEDWKSKLKNAFEDRYLPYLKDQFLVGTNKRPSEGQYESTLNDQTDVDEKILKDGVPENNGLPPEEIEITFIDRDIDDTLRRDSQASNFSDHDKVKTRRKTNREKIQSLLQLESELHHHIQSIDFENIIEKTTKAIDDFTSTAETLGMDKNSLKQLSFDEVISIHQRFKKPQFVKFINKIGRNKLYAQKLQYKKRREASLPIEKVTSSHHIDWMVDDEFINLALGIDAFENDFYDRFLQDHLLTFELVAEKDRRKGPIILCYDGSGSMEGRKIEETQAHIISIMEIARIQKRHLVLIQFASKSEPMYIKEVNPLSVGAKDILDVLDTFICGGTDFEKPLSKAAEYIVKDPRGQSDVLFITDGQCEISNAFKASFSTLKRARKFKLYTIIMHSHTYQDYGDIGEISDEILDIRRNDTGNWNEETIKKLYTLI